MQLEPADAAVQDASTYSLLTLRQYRSVPLYCLPKLGISDRALAAGNIEQLFRMRLVVYRTDNNILTAAGSAAA